MRKELSGSQPATTNNRMELLAAIEGLASLKRPCRVRLRTDSEYLQRAFVEGRLEQWARNGWKTRRKTPVQNVDLWQRLHQLNETHQVEWSWVKAHDGHPENTRADQLAVKARLALTRREV